MNFYFSLTFILVEKKKKTSENLFSLCLSTTGPLGGTSALCAQTSDTRPQWSISRLPSHRSPSFWTHLPSLCLCPQLSPQGYCQLPCFANRMGTACWVRHLVRCQGLHSRWASGFCLHCAGKCLKGLSCDKRARSSIWSEAAGLIESSSTQRKDWKSFSRIAVLARRFLERRRLGEELKKEAQRKIKKIRKQKVRIGELSLIYRTYSWEIKSLNER